MECHDLKNVLVILITITKREQREIHTLLEKMYASVTLDRCSLPL